MPQAQRAWPVEHQGWRYLAPARGVLELAVGRGFVWRGSKVLVQRLKMRAVVVIEGAMAVVQARYLAPLVGLVQGWAVQAKLIAGAARSNLASELVLEPCFG
jgi:hypothetical protein